VADIFQIKGVNSFLKVGEAEYRFADPNLKAKILLMGKFKELNEKRTEIPVEEYLLKNRDLNIEQIKMYLPEMPADEIEKMGDFAFTALLEKISDLTQNTFGAVVEKVEKK
jgi:hypothetical protein